jgi:hypothetical protein
MQVLTNVEFEQLVSDQSKRLRSIAKARCDRNPQGHVTLQDIDSIRSACQASGDMTSVKWLGSLRTVATNGQLKKLRSGSETWEEHEIYVHHLYAQKKIPFDLNQAVMLKDTGKRGKVVDYNPTTGDFIVVLNPFQVRNYPAKDLEKIAVRVD